MECGGATVTPFPNPVVAAERVQAAVAEIMAKWSAWRDAHPGQAAPLEEIRAELAAVLTPELFAEITEATLGEISDAIALKPGPVVSGEDPSVFG
jgi:hypothetical protein